MDGLGDIELVHGRQDDGRCGQEKQPHGESEVDAQPLEPPAEALDREVLPAEEKGHRPWRLISQDLAANLINSAHGSSGSGGPIEASRETSLTTLAEGAFQPQEYRQVLCTELHLQEGQMLGRCELRGKTSYSLLMWLRQSAGQNLP